MGRLFSREEKRPGDVREEVGVRARRTGIESPEEVRPRPGPVGLPSSLPCGTSLAAKKSVPVTAVRWNGAELPEPRLMSLTSLVPAAVPSDRHSSQPLVRS